MVLGFWDIAVPIVGAPMAGGPSTPALAAAVSNAGGLGFVAGGYLSADRLADDIAAARAATTGPIGANLFVPQPSVADWAQLEYYADELEEVAEYYHTEVGQPVYGDDDDWVRKLEVVADVRPEVVSFTFGAPPPDVVQRLSALGLLVSITVTSVYEAGVAIAAGADSLVVQGPAAGGHRGTFAPDMEPGTESLHQLLDRIGSAHDVPLVAAGGLGTAEDVAAVLRRGAIAAQVGTALLLADEAGTNAAHRAALKNPEFDATLVTRAFSGRYARGLANNFTRLLDHVAPLGYPEVHQMTKPPSTCHGRVRRLVDTGLAGRGSGGDAVAQRRRCSQGSGVCRSQRKRWTALDHDVHRYRRRSRSGFRFRCTVRHYSDFTLAIWHRRYRTRLSGYGEHLGPAAQLVPRSCPDGHRRQGSGERKHRAHSTHPAASQGPS